MKDLPTSIQKIVSRAKNDYWEFENELIMRFMRNSYDSYIPTETTAAVLGISEVLVESAYEKFQREKENRKLKKTANKILHIEKFRFSVLLEADSLSDISKTLVKRDFQSFILRRFSRVN